MAATVTARTSAPARRAPARRPASRRRRSGQTPISGFVPVAAAAGAVGGIADSGLFVWLTRGRLWIGLLGALLVGIVGLNVIALSFSASSSNAGQAADALRRQNSALRAQIAGRLSNSEIQSVAAKLDLVMPGPDQINYVRSSAGDAKQAADRLRSRELTIGGSTVPVEVAPVETTPVETAPVTDPATADPATAAVDPATTATAPVETAAPPVAETTATGGAVGAP